MKTRTLLVCAIAAAAAAATGCATIVARSTQTITVTSAPEDATVTIVNRGGTAVHSGTTPLTVTLKKGRGYFKPESYVVRFAKEGFQTREITVQGAINGWYFGNILFGGLIGMLAVDPSTGAMYTLQPKAVTATLEAIQVSRENGEHALHVVLVSNIPAEYQDQLIPVTN